MRYKQCLRRHKPVHYQSAEGKSFFAEKEVIIRNGAQTKVIKISSKTQFLLFALLLVVGMWTAYSYKLYSATDRIISYQEKQLDETRSAYVDLMSDFVAVRNNISSVMDGFNQESETQAENVQDYLKKVEVIEDKIRRITAQEDWIDEKDLGQKSALREAVIKRDMVLEENKLLKENVEQLRATIDSLRSFEMDILAKVENISNKEIDKVKTSLASINTELKKRGKYYNPLANSKKNSKGGLFVPDHLNGALTPELLSQAEKSYGAIADRAYYQEALQKIPLGKPVWTYWLTSPFGKRSDPINGKSSIHKGVDLAANRGS